MGFLRKYMWGLLAGVPLIPVALWAAEQWPAVPFMYLTLILCVYLLFALVQTKDRALLAHQRAIEAHQARMDAHERILQAHTTQIDVLEKRAKSVHNGGRFQR